MGSWHRLTGLRKICIGAAIVLSAGALVANAMVLGYLSSHFQLSSGKVHAASGWALFVAVVSLLMLPLLLTRAERIQRVLNRTGTELTILGTLTLFYFIAGIVLATRAIERWCFTNALCNRTKAAAAFCWLAFIALLMALAVLGLIARVQSRLGLPLFTAYAFDIEGQDIAPPLQPASHDMHDAALSLAGTHFPAASSRPA
ncbi:hypothetical protein H4R19_005911 [Coemansia spiralis]|nr:hypothetical protein H4R19_005911 [Coemansia spiralis]